MAAARLGVSKYLVVPLSLALLALAMSAPLVAAKNGGNSDNAKLCQKGGWMGLTTSDGTAFASEDDCVAYGAQGGSYDVLLSINGSAEPNNVNVYIMLPVGVTISGLDESYPGLYTCGTQSTNVLPCAGTIPSGTEVTIQVFASAPLTVTCLDGTQVNGTDHVSYWSVDCPTYAMDGPAQVSWTFATT